jgi:hypothetical protein
VLLDLLMSPVSQLATISDLVFKVPMRDEKAIVRVLVKVVYSSHHKVKVVAATLDHLTVEHI